MSRPATPVSRPGPVLGAHAPAAGGLARAALAHADATGAQVLQVYVSNPRGWALSTGDPAQDAAFRDGCAARGITSYVHASLLVNLGSPDAATVERSARTLAHALQRAAAIGAAAVVYHAGSAVRADRLAAALVQAGRVLRPLLDAPAGTGDDPPALLVEPSAGGGYSLAARVEALAGYLAAADHHPRLGVCFDTCHAFAAGHDLAAPGQMAATLDALVHAAGPGRLKLLHANDSKDPCGSTRDRHETIGAGRIGRDPFAAMLAHPALRGVPVVVETPSEGTAGHARDIATLRELAPAPRTRAASGTRARRPAR